MKKAVLFLIGVFVVSCSNDDNIRELQLVSVTTNYYADNEIWDFSKSTYVNEQLQSVKNLDESRTDYTYNKNLIATASNYESDGTLFSTLRFTFDSSDRLINFDIVYNGNEVTKYTITYNQNSIIYTYKNHNGNSLVYEFELNSNNQIISKKTISANGVPPSASSLTYQYIYDGPNLASVTSFNPKTNVTTPLVSYSYSTLKNEVGINKNMYGKAWKINSFLMIIINQGNYTPQVSENLVSSYKEGTKEATIKREYVKNKISKTTTEYMTGWNVAMKIEDIYEYK